MQRSCGLASTISTPQKATLFEFSCCWSIHSGDPERDLGRETSMRRSCTSGPRGCWCRNSDKDTLQKWYYRISMRRSCGLASAISTPQKKLHCLDSLVGWASILGILALEGLQDRRPGDYPGRYHKHLWPNAISKPLGKNQSWPLWTPGPLSALGGLSVAAL